MRPIIAGRKATAYYLHLRPVSRWKKLRNLIRYHYKRFRERK